MSDADGPLSGLGTDELRAMVRAVLREVLPAAVVAGSARVGEAPSRGEAPRPGEDRAVSDGGPVALADDAALDAFVRRVAGLCADPARRSALAQGRHAFRLVTGAAAATAAGDRGGGPAPDVLRVERGPVTERTVRQAGARGARLLLGPGAVLTPLARDRARALGVTIERASATAPAERTP